MSRKDELLALAERVEALTGPDREVDAAIAQAVGAEHGPRETVYYESRSVHYIDEIAPAYTASLDAAMSLVPEGWRWHSYYWPRKDGPRLMSLVTNRPHAGIAHGKAATPALALTAAALRAIATLEGQQP